ATADYAADGPVKIRFSSYTERDFPGAETKRYPDSRIDFIKRADGSGPLLLNVPKGGRAKSYIEKLAKIDADEGFVYVPGEVVKIHVAVSGAPAEVTVSGQRAGRAETFSVSGSQTLDWSLAAADGADDFELYQVEARQGGRVVARRGFMSLRPDGNTLAVKDTMGTLGWEFIEWAYSPFDLVCGFPESFRKTIPAERFNKNHRPVGGKFDNRLEPWNWVGDAFAPDLPKYGIRVLDWQGDPFAQPYTEWARWYHYFGADLALWQGKSWRWGEFNTNDIEHRMVDDSRKPSFGNGNKGWPAGYYLAANDGLFPNGMHFREWLGQIFYAAMKQACAAEPGKKTRIAEADHWNDRDNGPSPIHPRIIQSYLDYLRAKKLPHDDLDAARNSGELAELLQKSGTPERRKHYEFWNAYQVNLRGRQYIWEAAVKAAIDVNGYAKVDWLFGNGLVGDYLVIEGQGSPQRVKQDYEVQSAPWVRYEFSTDWDYMHWDTGSYRFAGQSIARMGALLGQRILNPDVYNEKVPHGDPKTRTDARFSCWHMPQTAAEHNRMFTYDSFMHYYDANGRVQRLVNWDYDDTYRNSWLNSLGILIDTTPGAEAHAILDHRQVSEGVTMDRPIGFVGVVSSPRTADIEKGTEFIIRKDTWAWFCETLVDYGVSLPAFVDAAAVDLLPDDVNLIYAPRKDGQGKDIISARVNGQLLTRPWRPRDHQAAAEFAAAVNEAAGRPLTFSDPMTTGYAFVFHGNRALVFVENKREEFVAEAVGTQTTPNLPHEQARTTTVSVALPFNTQGARVWDLTGFLPVPGVKVSDGRVDFVAPLRAGDGRMYVVIPAAGTPPLPVKQVAPVAARAGLDQPIVPWMDTAYEKVAYRNAIFANPPRPHGPRNYTMLDAAALSAPAPARVSKASAPPLAVKGSAPILPVIAPAAVVVVGEQAPDGIKAIAAQLSAALKKNGGAGKIFTDAEFQALPVSDSGAYHILAVGTVWDNTLLQRFNDPWTLDRDWYYGRLGNEPAWDWMPRTGYTVGFVGDFAADDGAVGNVSVDRSSLMWEARCKALDDQNPPDKQMPLRWFFRLTGSGLLGVQKAAQAFADDGLLNGTLPAVAPTGDSRYTLTLAQLFGKFPIKAPLTVNAADGHRLAYLGWNQADAEQYDGFYSKTGVAARRILRAKYVPEWGMTNFPSSPHRASTRFELCVIELADADAAQTAAARLAADGGEKLTISGQPAYRAKYGAHVVTKDNLLILESAPEPWGRALVEEYLKGK
ncbi:MAG: hypothetical protein LBK76_06555, partial [Verrucomicrobiales bacterium]|nr:hypothetical protein [Verrucomicrobiales bacterium]